MDSTGHQDGVPLCPYNLIRPLFVYKAISEYLFM